ncbi:ATP-dependent RNA helicase, DEAD box family [Cellvibrio japonicus Ueda107]|uniref:ATP-dependent RNA helicase, DEAD box family n=2 Tax=Cellvibrio japonicus TaxID=155077 RepID=B3PD22_CELJU|nr:ATP-dependent RNA helicase, DEAD box family [Cellvibrio japonicus Ueda107]
MAAYLRRLRLPFCYLCSQSLPSRGCLMSAFDDLIADTQLRKAIAEQGYEQPTEVQQAAIPRALEGKNLLVSSKTGSGKTAAFLLPCLQQILAQSAVNPRSTRLLILTPTRELARQIVKNAQSLLRFTSIKVGSICGGEELRYQKALLRKNPEIVVATPGRLAEHVAHKSTDFSGLEFLVLDEADRMLDMGLSEDVLKIVESCDAARQTLLFSATLEQKGLRHLIKQVITGEAEEIYIEDSSNQIEQQMVLADDDKHKERLAVALLNRAEYQKAIVFVNTKVRASQLDNILRYNQLRSTALHGDITQDDRKRVLEAFRQGKTRVLVATDVAARGLDIDGVDLVINLEMAHSGDEYLHRVGRTGRADQPGRAVSFVSASEWNLTKSIERYLKVSLQTIQIPGLEASYKGPDKLKKSGKAYGAKKKAADGKQDKKKGTTAGGAKKITEKVKVRERERKNIGKRRKPSGIGVDTAVIDGFAPPPKKVLPRLTPEADE